MLSNTAVPKYYGAFREAVLNREIVVCKNISMQMNRIDEKIANPAFYYDSGAIRGWIDFCEAEMTLTDGSDLKLLDSFKLWAEDLFSWFYIEEKVVYKPGENGSKGSYIKIRKRRRLTHKQFIVSGRGSAKSIYLTCVQAYPLVVDTRTTQQATTAPTIAQSQEVVGPFRTAIARSKGPLFKFLTNGSVHNTNGSKINQQRLASTKKGIENFLTNSLLESVPMSIDRFQGRRDNVVTVDEWRSGDIREDVIGAAEQGAAKNEDYYIVATSSEGTVRNGPGDDIGMELMKILHGEYYAPHVSIFWYRIDDLNEVGMPEMWIKANPNLGKTVSYETYQMDVEKMENAPASRNDILAKRFGWPSEGLTYFFTYEQTRTHPRQNFDGMQCSMGADLSRGDDFCSFTFLFPLGNGCFGIKTINFISAVNLSKLSQSLRHKYDEFIREGSLIVMDGINLEIPKVMDELMAYIDAHKYDVCSMGYDPYNATDYFVPEWEHQNGPYYIVKVIQGARTESVPLGELRNFAEQRALIFDQSIMQFAMGNCITLEDTNGNRKLYKKRNEQKIDPVAAMMDAWVAYKACLDNFA